MGPWRDSDLVSIENVDSVIEELERVIRKIVSFQEMWGLIIGSTRMAKIISRGVPMASNRGLTSLLTSGGV